MRGAVIELQLAGYALTGTELTITGDVPRGRGLSSSAALEVAVCLALLGVAGRAVGDRVALARICSRVEREWVGAQTGLLDQLASLVSSPRTRCGSTSARWNAATSRCSWVAIGSSPSTPGEKRALTGSGYNTRREECLEACRLLGVASLRDADPDAAAALPAPLDRRVRHVISENARVDRAVAALSAGEMDRLGELIDASHESLRDDYEVSTAAVEATVARLREQGALGARIVGGGFGGSVLALLAPGAPLPEAAIELRPGPPARLI